MLGAARPLPAKESVIFYMPIPFTDVKVPVGIAPWRFPEGIMEVLKEQKVTFLLNAIIFLWLVGTVISTVSYGMA